MAELLTPAALLSLLTLSLMEIVLGIDNIVFISILVGKLPATQQDKARKLGLGLALLIRLGLLSAINWIMGLKTVLFTVLGHEITGKSVIILGGGLFLVGKSTHEIYEKLEGEESHGTDGGGSARFGPTLIQILLLDIVFSLDSVITAVGMAQHLAIMATAMIVAVGVMLVFAKAVGDFVNRHPSMKILALSFLLLIGVMLIAEGWGQHVEKGYIYFAMAFSLLVEVLNMRFRKKQKPVHLRGGTQRIEKTT
ncbi:MAG: TerC family protein [Planctomycetaceae bacterium]|nr:TerC family protein [Planctomycetaceae bacterium]